MWNWYYGTKYSDAGEQLNEKDDKKVFNQIKNLNKHESEEILKPFLMEKINNENSELNQFIKIAEHEFKDKFSDACKLLEKITNKPISFSEMTFYVTTFPRMVVFFDESIIFMYVKINKELWGMPIDGFMHEGLHFQFQKYWRDNKKSPVSKLSEDDYFMLKESLTVILDEELSPIISIPDNSYPNFSEFRQKLYKKWQESQDFDGLVKFGLNELA